MKNFTAITAALGLLLALPAGAQTAAVPAGTDMPTLTMPSTSLAPVAANTTSAATSPPTVIVPEPSPADPDGAFNAGITAYTAGHYAKARGHFLTAESKAVSAPLEYNFGNACYQSGDFGEATLHYLRALSLSPRDPDARQNLALARNAANVTLPDPGWLDRFSGALSPNTWAWFAAISAWATIYLAFLPGLFRWRGATPWLLCAMMALVTLAAGLGAWGTQCHMNDGVALRADTPIKLSPTENSASIGVIQPGEVAQTVEEHNGFFKILTLDGHSGWVDKTSFARIWN